ncbi:hypothetical protein SD71_15145 [Cohnella kolymensis]|uniref:CAAX prenyl protease 2/Lysostaphin resistance protein A-like domain-containing protein n=1 Tax=Cohnella kolymensis TaxID=1590652 RepID=A0ABR5A1R9_9BACL|nr:CPBP family intramembrane glutamic endopeptidase [Cohnella kolymensis]KIL35012.1 hypothetical protein SD71_15145 [Cohnella kolymensis]
MKAVAARAPSYRLNPELRVKLNKLRLNIDTIGLYFVKVIFSLGIALPGWLGMGLGVYQVAAWITVLTVDPSRIPEAATTRIHQKQAWLLLLRILPAVSMVLGLLAWANALSIQLPTAIPALAFLLTCYMDELLFRNILQPRLRRLGLARWGAIAVQTALFTIPFILHGQSIGIIMAMLTLGAANGYIVYRHRSLWPAYVLALTVRMLCVGA